MRFRQRFRCWACKSSFSEMIGDDESPVASGWCRVWTMCPECGAAVDTLIPVPDPRSAPWAYPEYWTGNTKTVNRDNMCDL